jgi:ribonuclease P protein component
VYEKGAKSFVFPFKIYHLLSDSQPDLESPPFRVCIVVPKKRFKHAHDRNTIKRRTREALRLNKYLIDHKSNDKIIDIYLVYISNEIETQTKIDKAVKDVFKSFSK